MWNKGFVEIEEQKNKKVYYSVKHYELPNQIYGINGGRISKLTLKMDNKFILNYDRGWDIKPTCTEAKTALDLILKKYN